MWALMCCVCLVEADEFMRRRFAYNTICFIEFTNWIPLLTRWTKYLEWYEPGSHNQLSNAMFGNTCVIFCNSHIYFLAYLTQYSAHVLPFFWRHASRSFTFFTLSYVYTEPALVWDSLSASAVLCGVLPRQGIGFFPCYHALALQLAIHTRLPWPPCSCLCVFIRHLLLSSFDASTPHKAIHTTY